jgi:predicted acyltransferase
MGAETGRVPSVDAFRGLTLLAMFYVNSVDGLAAPDWMKHARGDGLTFVDLVAPFFLFIVGVSASLAREKQWAAGVSRSAYLRAALFRTAILAAVGILLVSGSKLPATARIPAFVEGSIAWLLFAVVPAFRHAWRIRWWIALVTLMGLVTMAMTGTLLVDWGILQAIAISYFVAASLCWYRRLSVELAVFALFAVVHILYIANLAPNGPGFQPLAHLGCIDMTTRHGGFPSALSWSLCTIAGTWAGRSFLIANESTRYGVVKRLGAMGIALAALGATLLVIVPFNKDQVTVSYTIFTAGLASLTLLVIDLLVRVRANGIAAALADVGRNALLGFVLSTLLWRWLRAIPGLDFDATTSDLVAAWGVAGVVGIGLAYTALNWLLIFAFNRVGIRAAV